MRKKRRWFVGVDGGHKQHQVCVLDADGRELVNCAVTHTGAEIAALLEHIATIAGGSLEDVVVGIEVPRGPLVEAFVERGATVFSINPKQLDRFRDRYSAAGAKDDRRDAFILADTLRGGDEKLFKRVRLDDPLIIQLRALTRVHDDVTQEMVRHTNQLRDELHRFFPQVLELGDLDEPWIWDVLKVAPNPHSAQKVKVGRIRSILKERRIRRTNGDAVLAVLREKPLTVAPGVAAAASEVISMLLPRLELFKQQLAQCDRKISAVLDELEAQPLEDSEGQKRKHRDVKIFRSLTGAGDWIVATMLAGASQALAERDYHTLRSYAGCAPVTIQSGKSRIVRMRYACSARLRRAVFHLARVNMIYDARAKQKYAAARSRGKSHGNALRIVGDWLLNVLITMLNNGTLYDTNHSSPARSLVTTGATA